MRRKPSPKMRQQKQVRLIFLTVLIVAVTLMYYTSAARRTRNDEFYTKTVSAMTQKAAAAKDAAAEAINVKQRLKEAEIAAKKAADDANPIPDQILQQQAASHVKAPADFKGNPKNLPGTGDKWLVVDGKTRGKVGGDKDKVNDAYDEEAAKKSDHEKDIELELNGILKKSPIIIFSKSYCPYSKKAKRILLEDFSINPLPYVVELDMHPMGADLQDTLREITGRQTVPNVLINGKSIGGGDDVENLANEGVLIDTVKKMGGTRIYEIKRNLD